MNSPATRLASVCLLAASLFLATTCVGAEPSAAQLPAACRAAKAEFQPLTTDDVKAARAELVQAADRLGARLDAGGQVGANWRKYLLWDELQRELRGSKDPDLAVLDKVYKKYTAGHEGLELAWFVDVREALRHYREIARGCNRPELKAAYGALLDGLAEQLQAYTAEPTAEGALVIGRAVGQLEGLRQAPALVRAIRHHFAQPNLLMEVSAGVVAAGITRPVDYKAPVRDVILGTRIQGTGHTVGEVNVELVPDPRRGLIDVMFSGVTRTKSTGYNGPAIIYSTGVTRTGTRKRLWIDDNGLHGLPAASNAVTETRITGVRSRRGRGGVVERQARQRAAEQKSQAELIAARHAEQRVNTRVDKQAGQLIRRANEAFVEKFREPLLRRKLYPERLCFSTTKEALHVVALQADASQLAAPSAPPKLIEPGDLAIRIHQSMIDNLAGRVLAGMTFHDEYLQATIIEVLGELPERLKPEEDQQPWAITFARQQPITVTFAQNRLILTMRGQRYYRGEDRYPAMDVTAVYKLAVTEQGIKAVRQGDLQIFPPGFVPGGGKKLSARQVIIRKLLERRINEVLEEELLVESFKLPGEWSKAGNMKPIQLASQNGWLTITWKRTPEDGI